MMETVAEVAEICKQMDAFDRLVWMATWEDTAAIVAGEDEDADRLVAALGERVAGRDERERGRRQGAEHAR